jgi:integrase
VALTHRTLEALRAGGAAYRVPDLRCRGLAIRVAVGGLKTWDLAYRIKGDAKVRRRSLGRFPDVSLDQARERAEALTRAARAGRDLEDDERKVREAEMAAEKAAASRLTVEELIERYVRRRVRGRLKTAKEIESRLRRALATMLRQPANEIRRRDLGELLDRVADSGIEREAEKRRQAIGAMYRWAVRQDLAPLDPTAGLTPYERGTPGQRVLSLEEIRLVWTWLESSGLDRDVADVLRLQIALGARCGEIAGLEVQDIDRVNWIWTLPATKSKNARARATPLLGIAQTVLQRSLSRSEKGRIFGSQAGTLLTASHVGHALLHRKAILPVAPFSTHDLRRSVATALAEMGIPLDLVAAMLGHEAGSQNTRTLLRHYVRTDLIDRKREAFQRWDAKLIVAIAGAGRDEKIVLLPQKGR